MSISKALYAFYQTLVHEPCHHARAHVAKNSSFCPDCGYPIKLLWIQIKCRECHSKRVPKKTFDGGVEPLHKYCRHCGSRDVRLVKKGKIESFEVVYSVPVKEIDYSEERKSPNPFQKSPYQKPVYEKPVPRQLDIVEGEVLSKRYVS